MSAPFRIIYDKARYPIQQIREGGTLGCRGCGGIVPKGRQAWCSGKCVKLYDPRQVIPAVRRRDQDICFACKKECYSHASKVSRHRSFTLPRPNYDHIIPFSEGGLTVLENIRTLCEPCHKERTRDWHGERAQAKKKGSQLSLLL